MRQLDAAPLPQTEERRRYFDAHERYGGFQDAVREMVEPIAHEMMLDEMRPVRLLRLTAIDEAALGFWDNYWRAHPSPHAEGDFPWGQIMRQIRTTPRRLDVAIWADNTLCGLCAGMAAKTKRDVAIRFLETFHGPNPLRGLIVPIAVECAAAYAQILGARRLKIRNPADGALPKYEAIGFRLVSPRRVAPYCEREV